MRYPAAVLVAAAVVFSAGSARADVQLHIENGQVTLRATNATVREILAEWARVGQTKIVNGERMPGGPVSLELMGVTEEQALEIILRSAAGYVVAPRAQVVAAASRYDRILVMPTSTPTRAAPPPPQQAFQQPATPPFQQPQFPVQFPPQFQGQFPPGFPRPIDDDGDADVQDDPAPNVVLPNPGSPLFNTAPAAQAPAVPFGRPTPGQVPAGVSVPGMVVPAPQQQPQLPFGLPVQPQDP